MNIFLLRTRKVFLRCRFICFKNCRPRKAKCVTFRSSSVACVILKILLCLEFNFSCSNVGKRRLPNLLNFLKDLKLEHFDFCNLDAISYLLCIIRSSPNLQLLDISAGSPEKYKAQILGYLERQLDFLDCSLDHLHNIRIEYICGAPPEMLMIKSLLAISPYLKNMVIQIDHCDAEKALRISTELLRFRRSSTGAEVTLIR